MADSIDWLCERLGLTVLEEDAGSPSLAERLHQMFPGGLDRAAVDSALDLARRGTPSELRGPGGERLLFDARAPNRSPAVVLVRGEPAAPASAPIDLAAGASHELANALGAIAGWARLARQGRRVQEALELIEMSADSAWSAARRVLGGARERRGAEREEDGREEIDLSAFVDEAARLLGPKATAHGVAVRTSIAPGLRVHGNRGSAWSIVWNLAANAVEALSSGGTVELSLCASDGTATLVVEDNGPGMTGEQQQRAFEPYFTTKTSGTGLGLPLVQQAVTEIGGRVELSSEPGTGTRFTVRLPLTDQAAVRAPSAKRSSGVFYAEPIPQRILVVDDDRGLREMVATALGMRGADVVAVPTAEAALAQPGPFAIAIVDLLLPDMRGDALLARLRSQGSTDLGMLVTGAEPPAGLATEHVPHVVLRKPFELEELFDGLTSALAAQRMTTDRSSAAG